MESGRRTIRFSLEQQVEAPRRPDTIEVHMTQGMLAWKIAATGEYVTSRFYVFALEADGTPSKLPLMRRPDVELVSRRQERIERYKGNVNVVRFRIPSCLILKILADQECISLEGEKTKGKGMLCVRHGDREQCLHVTTYNNDIFSLMMPHGEIIERTDPVLRKAFTPGMLTGKKGSLYKPEYFFTNGNRNPTKKHYQASLFMNGKEGSVRVMPIRGDIDRRYTAKISGNVDGIYCGRKPTYWSLESAMADIEAMAAHYGALLGEWERIET